jgi:hypothetical protein
MLAVSHMCLSLLVRTDCLGGLQIRTCFEVFHVHEY